MKTRILLILIIVVTTCPLAFSQATPERPRNYPAPVEGDYKINDFKFRSGETLPELNLHYLTIGTPAKDNSGITRNAVLIMHGTGGTGAQFLSPQFADVLFGPGQLLDATKYFIILPDAIGHGRSSKPSDGLHMKFPHYTYDDMVLAQYRLITEKLGVNHLRLVMGTSMGGMHTWVWGETYPDFMDALMPLASMPIEIAGRNRIMRKMIMDAIRNDPAWNNGEYKTQPVQGLTAAQNILLLMGSAPLQWHKQAPTRDAADKFYEERVKSAVARADANDMLYYFDSSREYNPSPLLEKIKAPLIAVNSADDLINPPELGVMEREIKRVKKGRYVLLPITDQTRGHGTHTIASIWQGYLKELLEKSAEPDLINADRPGIADGSTVVGPKTFQLESGFQAEFRRNGDSREHTLFVPTLLRFGIDNHWEVRLEGNTYTRVTSFESSSTTDQTSGFAPLSLGFKYHFYDSNNDRQLSLATIARVFPAWGSKEFRTQHATGDIRLAADWNFAPHLRLSLNPNIGVARYEDDQGRLFTAGLFAVTVNSNPTKKLNPFIDLGVQWPEVKNGQTSAILDGGLAYIIGRNVQVDAGVGTRVHGDTGPRPFIGFGISWRAKSKRKMAHTASFLQSKAKTEVPTLELIIDKYIQALGGRSSLEKVNSRASKGAFTSTQLKTKGPIELYAKAPNKWLMVLVAQGYGNYRRGFNGTVAWEKYPGRDNASNLSGFSKRDAEFQLPLKFRETFPKAALKDNEKLGERETAVLEAPGEGNPKRWYFDNESGLLLRSETRSSSGKILESVDYDDYRIVDGVKEPFSIRIVDRDGTDFNIKLSEVEHNRLIDDVSFDKPENHARDTASANSLKAKPEVRLISGDSTKIPYRMDDNGNELLQVRVNNSPPLNFTVDTGSDVFAILTSSQANNLGLIPGKKYKVGIAADVGEIEAATIPSANLAMPGVEALNQRIEVIMSEEAMANESKIDGVLGLEFLRKFVVEIDYEAQTLSLFAPEKYRYSGTGEVIPIKIKDGTPMVRLKVMTTGGKTIEDYFEVDNGMSASLVFRTPAVKKYGLLADMQTIQAPLDIEAGGEYRRRLGRLKSLQLGHFIIENPTVSLSENVEGEGGIIGEEILRRFKVVFDFSHHRMILAPNSRFKEPYEEDMSGISITPEDNSGSKVFRIRQVVANTPGSEAGLQPDDLITAVDGQPAASLTEGRIEHLFMQEGRDVALTIRRSDKEVKVRLKLRRLI